MESLDLQIEPPEAGFIPGCEILGSARWRIDRPVRHAEVRLLWFTRGKGTEDLKVVESQPVANPAAEQEVQFRFRIPNGPHSFSGKLISLLWAVELFIKPGSLSKRVEFVAAPGGKEIILGR